MEETKFKQTVYSINEFLDVDVQTWGKRLKSHHFQCMHDDASKSQIWAWFDCFNILQQEFKKFEPTLTNEVYLIFEYELLRERGRRPDVLLLNGNNLFVLEFKGYSVENQAQIDQVKHYVRDLKSYHFKSHELNVIPVLILASSKDTLKELDGVSIVSGDQLYCYLKSQVNGPFPNIKDWFAGEYAPLPSLIQSSQLLFKEKKFPQIKNAQSAGIPEVLSKLHKIANSSENEMSHHLVLITGVPGAGKTLVGLQFVFEEYVQENKQKAVFLSGNGPLVQVLQHSLNNRHFVQAVHGFLKEYAHSNKVPNENVIIYDEAQRAWDAEKVGNSHRDGNNSEPIDFINIADRKSACLIIGLIGEGQEIHLGEESGMKLWTEAIENSNSNWVIHCPEKLIEYFPEKDVMIEKEFNLTTSLRTHQALTLQSWVESLLSEDIEEAKELSTILFEEDYFIYITRDLQIAKNYVKEKYYGEDDKTYGLIASSKSKILPNFGVKNDYNSTKSFKVTEYYVDRDKDAYCTNLNSVVTEFACQGLELDMPILAWETDYVYQDGWKNNGPNQKAKNPDKLKENSYRVLLTRGRDGLIIFVPNTSHLDSTYNVLVKAGCNTI